VTRSPSRAHSRSLTSTGYRLSASEPDAWRVAPRFARLLTTGALVPALRMKKPYTIAINSVSGGGKTSLAKLLQESLVASVVFCFDDFDKTNRYPEDFYEWWKRGADLREFDCPGLRKAVDEEIRTARIDFIILDYPFGRDHPRFENLIGLSVFVDTLLDVAMARRIMRDYGAVAGKATSEVLE